MGIHLFNQKVLSVEDARKERRRGERECLNLVIKSEKFMICYRNTIKAMRIGEANLIIIANNCPAIRRTELEYYAALCGSAVHNFEGNNLELGTACGKLFAVSTLIISDPGDSDILETL